MNIFTLDYIVLIFFSIYALCKLLRTNMSKEKDKGNAQVPHQEN